MSTIDTLTVKVGIDASAMKAGAERVKRAVRGIGKDTEKDGDDAGHRFGTGFASRAKKILGGMGPILKTAAVSAGAAFVTPFIASIVAGLASGTVKLAKGFGAALALLPAAALAGGLALGALKIGLSGVGDALSAGLSGDVEAFAEALKGMAPAAQKVLREVAGLKGAFDQLKGSVQGELFGPLVGQVRPLADLYLPIIGGELTSIAAAFGATARSMVDFLRLPATAVQIASSVTNAGTAVRNLIGGLGGLLQALMPLVTVGSSFLPGLTHGFDAATGRLAAFMAEAEKTGRLHKFISDGLSAIGDLVDTGQQLVRIFTDIGSTIQTAMKIAGVGTGGLLDSMERGADSARKFVESARGAEVLGAVFDAIGKVAASLIGTVTRIGSTLATAFGPIMPQVGAFLSAMLDLKAAILDTGLDALGPILNGLGVVLGTVVLPPLTALASWLADNQPVLQAIGIAIMVMLIPAFVAWAISAGTAAIATLAAMAPLLLIGAAIALFAYLVITHWDTIQAATKAVFGFILGIISGVVDWVRSNWPLLLAIITGPFGLAVLAIVKNWDTIKAATGAVKDWIVARFNDVVSFFSGLPGRISSIASNMWNGLKDSFRNVLNAIISLWNRISFTLPKISIPSVDVPGLGKIGGGSFGGQTFRVPQVPQLARGGIARATPGGTLVNVGEGGHDEAIMPLPRGMKSMGTGGNTVNIYPQGSILSERDLFRIVEDAMASGRLRVPSP